jgi:hypothetical protein
MSQNRKKKRKLDRTTCQTKLNPGPVNNMRTVAEQRIINARINRVLFFNIGSGS